MNRFANSRFLFVIGQYTKLGGAEWQAIVLADQLRNQLGCHVDFLAWGGEGRVTEELKVRGIKAWVFPLDWNRSPLKRVLTLWQLARFIKREIKPDYLLPYIGFNCKIIGLIWRRAGAKYTWWNQRDEGREVYGSHLERYVIKSVPDIVSNSFEGRDFLVHKFDLVPDRIHVLNNGITIPKTQNRQKWRERLGLKESDILITMVANLTKYKDHETLLLAFSRLLVEESSYSAHLLLVGRLGETTERLKVLSFDLGLCGKVHFVGEVESVSECYAATDLAVHSSVNEGCPNAVLEAMAHGLAVCGTDIAGVRQAVGNDHPPELLAPARAVDSLRLAMQRLAEDSELRMALGRRNKQRISDYFSPEKLAESVLTLIRGHHPK